MIAVTSIHLFKIRTPTDGSWGQSLQGTIKSLIQLIGCDAEKEKIVIREVALAEQGYIDASNKYIHKDALGYTVSLDSLMAVVTEESIKAYYALPNSLKGWKDKKNKAFLDGILPQLFKLADSDLIDLLVLDKIIYGSPDWVFVFIKNSSVFYGFDSLTNEYNNLKANEIVDKYSEHGCIEVKNTFFSKRKAIKKFKALCGTPS